MGRYDQAEAKKNSGVMIGVITVLLVGGSWLYFSGPEQPEPPDIKDIPLPQISNQFAGDKTASPNVVSDQPPPDLAEVPEPKSAERSIVLPELSNSDGAFREAMLDVSSQLAPWLKADQLIRKYTTVVNDFSQGLRLEKHMRFLKQAEPFSVERTENAMYIASESYRRYDKLAEAVDAMDAKAAVRVFRKFMPLFSEVFNDFGYPPERPLDDIFLKAAAQILAAPVIDQPIELVRPSVLYKFADEKMEGLSPVSKQMLRMGPKNTRIIQYKVRQLVEEWVNDR